MSSGQSGLQDHRKPSLFSEISIGKYPQIASVSPHLPTCTGRLLKPVEILSRQEGCPEMRIVVGTELAVKYYLFFAFFRV
jgi:hypothetical protein